MKKYELTSETQDFMGRTLYRIKALVSFGDVRAGFTCWPLKWRKRGLEMRTRNERRQRRQEMVWTGLVVAFVGVVFGLGLALGVQL